MPLVFDLPTFQSPYDQARFPGQHQDEKIFFITRAAPVMLWARLLLVILVLLGMALGGAYFLSRLYTTLQQLAEAQSAANLLAILGPILSLIWIGIFVLAVWWVRVTWRRTVFIVTNKRLTQFVFTTPWTNYQLSLSLDKVVDTAATTHSYFQRMAGVGDLFARSAAGAQGDFLVENIVATRDLHNWLTKLLYEWEAAEKKGQALTEFAPFIIRKKRR